MLLYTHTRSCGEEKGDEKNLVFLNKRQTCLHMTSCPGYHVVIRDSVLIKKGSTGDILKFTDHRYSAHFILRGMHRNHFNPLVTLSYPHCALSYVNKGYLGVKSWLSPC